MDNIKNLTKKFHEHFLELIVCLIMLLSVGLIVVFFYPNCYVSFVNIGTGLVALIGLFLFQLRNDAMTKQTKSQYDIFNKDKQFTNFLEATKLLTDKDSTANAKIAAMFSLADVATGHPEHLDRIIQVINKELSPLIRAIEGKENANKYTSVLKEKEVTKKPLALRKETELFSYTQNKIVSFGESRKNQEKIKNWQHKGNETEKIVSVALYVIRKIILELKSFDSKFDFSNTIFFDIDTDFDKKSIGKKFIRKDNKRIENAIFLNCKLNNVDFSETNFHYCKFINCELNKANFNAANLWGTSFNNCDLKNTIYSKAEFEGVQFKNCNNLTAVQLGSIKSNKKPEEMRNLAKVRGFSFTDGDGKKYKKSNLKYLITIDNRTMSRDEDLKQLSLDNFISSEEYEQWKNSDKS